MLLALDAMRARIAPLTRVAELRSVAADDVSPSPSHGRGCPSIHVSWKPDWPAARAAAAISSAHALLDAWPQWVEPLTSSAPRPRIVLPRLDDFRALAGAPDPAGKFRSAFLDGQLFGDC